MSMSLYDTHAKLTNDAMTLPLSKAAKACIDFLRSIQSNADLLSLIQKLYIIYSPDASKRSLSPYDMVEEMIDALNSSELDNKTVESMFREISMVDLKNALSPSMYGGKKQTKRNRNGRRSTRKQYGGVDKKRIMLLMFATMTVLSSAMASQPTCATEIGGACQLPTEAAPACKTWAQISWDSGAGANYGSDFANTVNAFNFLAQAFVKITKCGWSWT